MATAIICSKCLTALNPNAKFCRKCGTKVIQKSPQNQCPACKKANKLNARFCAKCGTRLTEPRPTKKKPSQKKVVFEKKEEFTSIELQRERERIRFFNKFKKEVVDLEQSLKALTSKTKHSRGDLEYLTREITDVTNMIKRAREDDPGSPLIAKATALLKETNGRRLRLLEELTDNLEHEELENLRHSFNTLRKEKTALSRFLLAVSEVKKYHVAFTEISFILLSKLENVPNKELTISNAFAYDYQIREMINNLVAEMRKFRKSFEKHRNDLEVSDSTMFIQEVYSLKEMLKGSLEGDEKSPIASYIQKLASIKANEQNFEDQLQLQEKELQRRVDDLSSDLEQAKWPYIKLMEDILMRHSDAELRKMRKKAARPVATTVVSPSDTGHGISTLSSMKKTSASDELQPLREFSDVEQVEELQELQELESQETSPTALKIDHLLREVSYSIKIKFETENSVEFEYLIGGIKNFTLVIKGDAYELQGDKSNFWGTFESLRMESSAAFDYKIRDIFSLIDVDAQPDGVRNRLVLRRSTGERFLKIRGFKQIYAKNNGDRTVSLKLLFDTIDRENLRAIFDFLRDIDLSLNSL